MKGLLAGVMSLVIASSALFGVNAEAARAMFAQADTLIPIDEAHFPDEKFRELVSLRFFNANGDDYLDAQEIADTVRMDVCDKGVTSLKGIQYFTELKTLDCTGNKLRSLDLTKNTKLQNLYCYANELTEINVSGLNDLETFMCDGNPLSQVNIMSCKKIYECVQHTKPKLKHDSDYDYDYWEFHESSKLLPNNYMFAVPIDCTLDCRPAINAQNFPDAVFRGYVVKYIDLNKNKFLDLDEIAKTTGLSFNDDGLTSLQGIRYLTGLRYVECECTNLSEVDFSYNHRLQTIDLHQNNLKEIDLSQNPFLLELDLSNNKIEKLDLSKNTQLESLDLTKNKVKKLDIKCCPALKSLFLAYCPISEIDLSNSKELVTGVFAGTDLKQVDLYYCPNLVELAQKRSQTSYTQYDVVFLEHTGTTEDTGVYLAYGENMKVYLEKPTITPTPKVTVTTAPDIGGAATPGVTSAPSDPTAKPTSSTEPSSKEASFDDFVERLYTVALGRASEEEGKAHWVDQVVNNGLTGADCARFFLLSAPEFLNRKLSDDQFVEILYLTFFDRASEADGKTYWLDRLKSGTSKEELVNEFIESDEWCNVCSSYGVKSGSLYHKATMPSNNAIKFATRLYTCCLKRDPEAEGLAHWALALTNLEVSGYQAGNLFFTLPEFVGFNTSDEEFLTRLYTTFMDREPDKDGSDYWMGLLQAGTGREDVIRAFAGCPEFTGICNSYGIQFA